MVKYSCEQCGKFFSQKSHYDSHNRRKTPCENNADKIKALVDKAVEEKIKELNNKKLIIDNKEVNNNTINMNTPTINKISNISPLRYPGGKTRACKKLDTILKEHFDINKFNNIVSPFFGGGSFEFHIQNTYGLNIIANDKFVPLYNFWKICKSDKENLYKELAKKIDLIDKEEFTKLRKKIMEEKNKLNQSIMYFIINRCSFSGATLSGGFSLEASKKRFTKSSIDRIKQLDLTCYDIYNLDFKKFINNNQDEKNLLFLDPPYYLEKASTLYGNNGDMHDTFDHDKLYKCLSKKKNWFMTYNNCDYIKKLYKDFKIIETSWSYGMNKSKKSSEIVIIG
jgi:DNA adenine methylase